MEHLAYGRQARGEDEPWEGEVVRTLSPEQQAKIDQAWASLSRSVARHGSMHPTSVRLRRRWARARAVAPAGEWVSVKGEDK